jgi:uncharacterized membrane protein YfcA
LILTGSNTGKERFRQLMSIFFLFSYGFAVFLYSINNLISKEILVNSAASLPLLFAGLATGEIISRKINQKYFRLVVLLMLIVMGGRMVIKGFL